MAKYSDHLNKVNYEVLSHIETNRFVSIDSGVGAYETIIHYIIAQMTFHDHSKVLMLGDPRKHLIAAKQVYTNLPASMKPVADKNSALHFHLENDSAIVACGYKSSAMRGYAFNMVFMDDFAAQPKIVIDSIWTNVYPAISYGAHTRVVILAGENPFDEVIKTKENFKLYVS